MANKKTDVFDYLDWRGELTFQQSEFNEIDALILSIYAYLDFSCTQGWKDYPFVDAVNMICALPDEVKYDGPSSIYQDIRGKILSFVPESSIVGVLMEHDQYITILSKYPTVLQHDPFSWLVIGSHFIYDNDRTISGMQFERIINSWIRAMSPQEREEFVENIYDIIISSNAKTLDDLDKKKLKSIFLMSKTFREMGIKKQAQLLFSLSKVV